MLVLLVGCKQEPSSSHITTQSAPRWPFMTFPLFTEHSLGPCGAKGSFSHRVGNGPVITGRAGMKFPPARPARKNKVLEAP